MKRRNLLVAAAVGGMLLAAPGQAHGIWLIASGDKNGIAVENAWSRAAMTGRVGAVYFTITTNGAPDRLVAVSTPVAQTADIHESFAENNVMTMRPVGALPITQEKPLTLAPGGYHVMLMGLKRTIAKGESFPLTLTFEHAAPMTVQVRVESAGASGPSAAHGAGHAIDTPTQRVSKGGT